MHLQMLTNSNTAEDLYIYIYTHISQNVLDQFQWKNILKENNGATYFAPAIKSINLLLNFINIM